jgi:LacI family transcriptional regulator
VNDYIAVHTAERLSRLGLAIPQDIALIGFDNIVRTLPEGVGLTTVAQPFEEIGKAAANLFIRRSESPSTPPAHIELPTELIIRESSESPAISP